MSDTELERLRRACDADPDDEFAKLRYQEMSARVGLNVKRKTSIRFMFKISDVRLSSGGQCCVRLKIPECVDPVVLMNAVEEARINRTLIIAHGNDKTRGTHSILGDLFEAPLGENQWCSRSYGIATKDHRLVRTNMVMTAFAIRDISRFRTTFMFRQDDEEMLGEFEVTEERAANGSLVFLVVNTINFFMMTEPYREPSRPMYRPPSVRPPRVTEVRPPRQLNTQQPRRRGRR